MDIQGDPADSGCTARIWHESWCDLPDRKTISADHPLYDHNITCYCVDPAKSAQSTCKYIYTGRRWILYLWRLCDRSNCTCHWRR